jgi:hypothetical protein
MYFSYYFGGYAVLFFQKQSSVIGLVKKIQPVRGEREEKCKLALILGFSRTLPSKM